ncbi:hypothetical protein [Novosphingobium sp. G106]|uniref:hypothetical protein n=1 Tax=Novosphingobium sp. G106 TaxID=2849500 RepID=UPI0020C2A401|nr:hypothetical protein [Novosphingobium sp. G106]
MRNIDFSSWQSVLATLFGLALVTLIGVGIRLVAMSTIQQRRERVNRQINERLRTLIAAYKTLGGSFTGDLAVDPRHLRQLRETGHLEGDGTALPGLELSLTGSDRSRRIRDTVEAALSDIILLGTERHVRLAEKAARELVAGHPVHTHELVIALRDFIREALDLDPIPHDLAIPMQGPARPSSGGGKGKGDEGRSGGNEKGGGGMGMGMGMGAGMGGGLAIGGLAGDLHEDHEDQH